MASRSPPRRSGRDPCASSPSLSAAPDRGRGRSRDRTPAPREVAPSRSKGKGKQRVLCDICWQQTSSHQSAIDQHRRWNLLCLSWQRYNRGGISWEDAKQSAARRKARRDARALAEMGYPATKTSPVLRAAPARRPSPSPERPERSHHEGRRSTKENRSRKEKKLKKEVKAKSVRPSPSPEVVRRRRRPPSSDSDDPGKGPDQAPQQLVITLPPGCKFG